MKNGTKTITAQINSNQNNPDDHTCTVTISAVAGDSICSSGETDTGTNNGCQSGYDCSNGSCVAETTGGVQCGDGTCEGSENCATCPEDCGYCVVDSGNGAPSATPTPTPTKERETILEKTIEKKPTGEELRSILERAGASQTAIEKAVKAVEKTSVKRHFKVEKITSNGETSYQTTVTIEVENKGNKKMKNVKVVESIPKNVFASLSEEDIESELDFEILQADPIVQFIIPEIGIGGTTAVEYTVDKDINSEQAGEWEKAVVAEFEEVELCEGKECPEAACKIGECNPETGKCEYTNAKDGVKCAEGKECKSGKCVPVEPSPTVTPTVTPTQTPTPTPTPKPKADYTGLIAIIVLLIIAVLVYFFWFKGKEKTPLQHATEKAGKEKGEKEEKE